MQQEEEKMVMVGNEHKDDNEKLKRGKVVDEASRR